MTDFRFSSDEIQDFETVSEFSMEGYEKYRLKADDLTIDLAIVDLEDRDAEDYITQRKNEISGSETEVPHPYKPEKTSEGGKVGETVKFRNNPVRGTGKADPEYNLVSEESDKIIRYDYLITWKEFPEKDVLVELEAYTPPEKETDYLKHLRSIKVDPQDGH